MFEKLIAKEKQQLREVALGRESNRHQIKQTKQLLADAAKVAIVSPKGVAGCFVAGVFFNLKSTKRCKNNSTSKQSISTHFITAIPLLMKYFKLNDMGEE